MAAQTNVVYSSAREVLYVLFRHKWKIFFFFLLVSGTVIVATYAWPKAYQSEGVLLLRLGRENLPGDLSIQGAMLNVTQDRTSEVKSVLAILSSHELAKSTVDRIGEGWILDRPGLRREELPIDIPDDPALIAALKSFVRVPTDAARQVLITLRLRESLTPYEQAIQTVERNLTVEMERQTNIVNVYYEAKSPSLAMVTLSTLVDLYLDKHIEIFATQAPPAFFATQTERLAGELLAAETAFEQFRSQHSIRDITVEREVLLAQISALEGELSDASAEAVGLQALVEALEQELAGRPRTHELSRTTGLSHTAADRLKERLTELRLEETDLAARYNDSYRPLQELREQISVIESQLGGEPEFRTEITSGLDANYEGLKNRLENERAQLKGFLARQEALRGEITRHRETLDALVAREVGLSRLRRDMEMAEKEYRRYRDNLEEARLSVAMDQERVSNVSVVQAASLPLDPIRPKKLRSIGLGLLLALFGGICFAFLLEWLDDSLNTVEGTERTLGVPVLTSLSEREFEQCT
jgi:uncharacterized protein involved in exopolysaccharide biosynthesis